MLLRDDPAVRSRSSCDARSMRGSPDPPVSIPLLDDRQPWDRQPDEPPKAFAKFAVFRDLGPSRTLAAAATETGVSRDRVVQLSAAYSWVDRASAFDATRTGFAGLPPTRRSKKWSDKTSPWLGPSRDGSFGV